MTNLLLVGCYTPPMGTGRGISLLSYADGALTDQGLVALTESPSFLIAHEQIVYAVNEAEQGRVTSFRWSPDGADSGSLHQVAVQNTGGAHPCQLAIDPSGTVLAAANYTSGSVSLHRIDGAGAIEPRALVLEHSGDGPVSDRQDAAHAHQVMFANDLMYVVDLGSDRVWRYRLDATALTVDPAEPLVLPAGFGPRQFVIDGDHAYVLGELSNQLAAFAGTELVSLVPAYGADVPPDNLAATLLRLSPGYLLVSHRGADRICVFTADGDSVVLITEFSSAGRWPRHVAVADGRLVLADQLSDLVVSRSEDGAEVLTVSTPNPTCVLPLS